MPYYDVANLVTITKTNMIDEMACGYGTIRTTAVRIRHQVSRRAAQRSQLLQNLTILQVNSCSILNAPPSLQVLSGAPENALAESESTLLSSRGAWEHLEVLRSGEFNRPVRPGTTQDGTGRCHAVHPGVGRKRCRLFEAGQGRTERTAGDGEEPSPVVIHRYPWILVYITKLICKTE